MRSVLVVLGLVGCVVLGCDALEPEWSEPMGISGVNPKPDATCNDVCALTGNLCLEDSCGGATVRLDADEITAACEEPIWSVVGEDAAWSGYVSCCCGSNP
jgi:hypothetical protein